MKGSGSDYIKIEDLALPTFPTSKSRTLSDETLPLSVLLEIFHDCTHAARLDDLEYSINYASLSDSILNMFKTRDLHHVDHLEAITDMIFEHCFHQVDLQELSVQIQEPLQNAPLHSTTYKSRRSPRSHVYFEAFTVNQLKTNAIIGIHPEERVNKQSVLVDITIERNQRSKSSFDYEELVRRVLEVIEGSQFLTLEALTSNIAKQALKLSNEVEDDVVVCVSKPQAIPSARSAQICLRRSRRDFGYPESSSKNTQEQSTLSNPSFASKVMEMVSTSPPAAHTVSIAFGTNLGDRFANIEHALRLLEDPMSITKARLATDGSFDAKTYIIDTSFLYETAPMYVTDQPDFVNGACLIVTELLPTDLLKLLKYIETTVGRVPSIRNGPRAIDLDVLTYDRLVMDTRSKEDQNGLDNLTGHLLVPHPRMLEREFVLRPLADIMPEWIHPIAKRSIRSQLNILMHAKSADEPLMYKALPFPSARTHARTDSNAIVVPSTAQYWKYPLVGACGVSIGRTHLMATLNVTPDSFSDGSAHETVTTALSYVEESVVAGAHIIDIGGYSTRPGAAFVSLEEEIGRVVPIIQAVRSKSTSAPASTSESKSELGAAIGNVLISVDTFRPEVAKAAVLAGANCINDVYAFVGPQYPLDEDSIRHFVDLRRLARELAVPVILMHSRGDAGQNKDYTAYQHANAKNVNGEPETGSVIKAIKNELGQRVEAAVRGPGGLRRWQIIVDPGVGFSKTLEGNLEVLRHASRITSDSFLVPRPRETTQEKKENPLFGFPQLIGASRKSFLGAILEREDSSNKYEGRATQPKERSFATAAAVVAAVQQGALITRVHDVLEMGDVVRVANAIWH